MPLATDTPTQLVQPDVSLLQLPTEILIYIFNHVGSSYFRSDISRLTICRQWSELARTACFQDFYVDQKTLRRLSSPLYTELSLRQIKDCVEALFLDLKGFEDWDSSPVWHLYQMRLLWRTELNNDLLYLAKIMGQSRKLRIMRIRTTSEVNPHLPHSQRGDYLFLSTIRAFLSASNLTNLELDLCGIHIVSLTSEEYSIESHVCTDIATLLTTLRRLRLRMRSICANVLELRQHGNNLRLEEMIINLSLSNESPQITSASHAKCCVPSTDLLQLKADLERQAQALVAQMAAPKIVRILTHALPSFEMRAFDVLTGKNVKLGEGADWDDEGEVIEDKESDAESEIPDLSSDDGE
jgi:hypothetical protein